MTIKPNKNKIVFTVWCLVILFPVFSPADTTSEINLKPQLTKYSDVCGKDIFRPYYSIIGKSVLLSGQERSSGNRENDCLSFKKRVVHDLGYAWKTTLSDFKYIYSSPARIKTGHALWLGGILAVGGVIFAYDQEIYDAIHRNKNHKLYKPVRNMGETLEPLGYMGFTNKFIFGALFAGYLVKNELMVNISADILESFLIGSVGKNIGMVCVGREGPMIKNGPRSFKFNDGRSFPSGHSNAIMQMASVLSHHIDFLPFRAAAYGGAATVLLQRITSDHHWPSDVYAGAVYGFVISHELLKLKKSRRVKISPASFDEANGTGMIITYRL